jgi:DNA replication protein DnaC
MEQTTKLQKILNELEKSVIFCEPECKTCGDSGYIVVNNQIVKPCKCKLQKVLFLQIGELASNELQKVIPRPNQVKAVNRMLSEPFKSYVLLGNVRTGKTFLASSLYCHIIYNYLLPYESVIWLNDVELKNILLDRTYENGSFFITKIKERIMKMIFIDDFGKAITSDIYLEQLFYFFDCILNYKTKLVLTSIMNFEKINSIYGASITRRIEDIADYIFQL